MSLSEADDLTEGAQLSYTLTRTWGPGQSQGELSVNVRLAQTGDYITWPAGRQPDAEGLVTIPVTFVARSLTAILTLETVDDEVSEADGSVTATILADIDGSSVTGADSDHTTKLKGFTIPVTFVARSLTAILTLETVDDEVSEADGSVTATILADIDGSSVTGADSDHTTKCWTMILRLSLSQQSPPRSPKGPTPSSRFIRLGNTSVATRFGLYVGGLPKIMTDATEATVLASQGNTVGYGARKNW